MSTFNVLPVKLRFGGRFRHYCGRVLPPKRETWHLCGVRSCVSVGSGKQRSSAHAADTTLPVRGSESCRRRQSCIA